MVEFVQSLDKNPNPNNGFKKLHELFDCFYFNYRPDLSSTDAFLKSWEKYDRILEKRDEVEKRIRNSKKFKETFKEPYDSGYSMGEWEFAQCEFVYMGSEVAIFIEVRDNREKYSGAYRKYNSHIAYGYRKLIVTYNPETDRCTYKVEEKHKR